MLKIEIDCEMYSFGFEGAKRIVMNGAMTFFAVFIKIITLEEWWNVENQVTSML